MTTRSGQAYLDLARAGFTDGRRAERLLQTLAGLLAGSADLGLLTQELAAVPDPDAAVLAMVQLLEVDRSLAGLLGEPGTARSRVLTVLGGSVALAQHLVRHPEHVGEVADPAVFGVWRSLPAPGELTQRLTQAVQGRSGREGMRALRVAYKRELVLVAAADLTAPDPLEAMPYVAASLAALADAALEAALILARAEVDGEQGCRMSIIGMGKCGGRELNYISDVDVIFLAAPAEPDGPEAEEQAMTVGARLAAAVIRICGRPTAEGSLWPVDAALRPEGKNGPLVRSLASHQEYYQRWAKTWEFQALLKARHSAGDHALSQEWLDLVRPLVWQASHAEEFVGDVQAMRRRVEQQVPPAQADRQLKLGPGGLRDIEFSVQLLQLVHGRADESLRSGTTLQALAALRDGGYVGRDDAAALDTAYRFLRVLEHRTQLDRLRRTHTMPSAEADLRRLGRSVGERGDAAAGIVQRWRGQQREVRRLHERLFYAPLLTAVARLSTEEVRLSPEAARERLSALGFQDPAGAMRHLEALTGGVSRRATIQRHLLPVMLGWFADGADPDAGLLAFRRISDALGTTHWYLKMLRDEGSAAQRLAHVLASSRYVVDLLIRSPESVALLGDPAGLDPVDRRTLDARMAAAAGRQDDAADAFTAVRVVRARELLRIALADLVGDLDQDGVRAALTALTEALLGAALTAATRAVVGEEEPVVRLLIVGMGRLGGAELGYASDADVMFAYQPIEGAPSAGEQAAAIVTELTRRLSAPGLDPVLEVDASLRPEGKAGPLVRSLASYAAYYDRWSAGWESQALLRARPVAGDAGMAVQFEAMIQPLRWPPEGLDPSTLREIRTLKARMEAERLPRGGDPRTHFKLGLGGITDVEWVAQLLQLQHAHEVTALRTTSTLRALSAARQHGLLTESDEQTLRAAWSTASRLRDAGVLWRGRPVDGVPSGLRDAEGISRIIGRAPGQGGGLGELWRRHARRCRQVVERLLFTTPGRPAGHPEHTDPRPARP